MDQTKLIKRKIKLLASGPDINVVRAALEKAPAGVIRGVCNTAVHSRLGEVQIPNNLKPLFRLYHKHIDTLIDRQHPVEF